jgi:hypothetical protein
VSPGSWISALLAVALAGCSLSRPELKREEFLLHVGGPTLPPPKDAPVLSVRFFQVSSEFENREFVYRLAVDRWESDFYHIFALSPAEMLTGLVREDLARSGLVKEVAIPGLGPSRSWRLQGFVTELYADFRDLDNPRAVIGLQISVFPAGSGYRSVPVFNKTYRREAAFSERRPQALVLAWNRAAAELLAELRKDLSVVLRQQAESGQ